MTDIVSKSQTTANWIAVGRTEDFSGDEHACITAGGKPVVVFNVDGRFHVISNLCPHAGLPLGDGERRGLVITCPYHGYAYRIDNGRNIDWPHEEPPVRTYPTRVVDGVLEIEMEQPVSRSIATSDPQEPQRGPAPQQKPPGEGPACDPDPAGGDAEAPQCPTGYPNEEGAPPQQPSPDKPRPKTEPTEEGN